MDWYVMVRGLERPQPGGGKEWLGLLAEPDLAMMREQGLVTSQVDFTVPRRLRFYRAEIKPLTDMWGRGLQYQNPTALPDSPKFLMGGLLTEGPSDSESSSAMQRRDPESVFVLSRDRLGDEGRLQLARIAVDKGTPVWSVALPLSDLSAWIPGERHAVLLGPNPTAPRSPMAEENGNPAMQILSIDLTTGVLQSFNPDLHRDWPVQKAP